MRTGRKLLETFESISSRQQLLYCMVALANAQVEKPLTPMRWFGRAMGSFGSRVHSCLEACDHAIVCVRLILRCFCARSSPCVQSGLDYHSPCCRFLTQYKLLKVGEHGFSM